MSSSVDASGEQPTPGKRYTADGVTVFFDAKRCRHFAECVRGLPAVFNTDARPWIEADAAPPETVAEVVRRCPTGALHYALTEGPPEDGGPQTTVVPIADGPLLLRGSLRIQQADDAARWVQETRMAACSCGRTSNKPYCDGACKVGIGASTTS